MRHFAEPTKTKNEFTKKTVRIIAHKTENCNKNNLFGTINSDWGEKKIILQLTEIKFSKEINSDIIELIPQIENETFRPLEQYYSVMANESLKCTESENNEHKIYGNLTIN